MLACFFLSFIFGELVAAPRIIEPGEMVKLGKNEGILAFAADSDAAGFRVRIKRTGGLFSYQSKPRQGGLTVTLMVVPSGQYRFIKIEQGFYYFTMDNTPNMRFNVLAQRINYPGDFQINSKGNKWFSNDKIILSKAAFAVVNRSLRTKRALESAFPELTKAYPLRYAGEFPDPFLERLPNAQDQTLNSVSRKHAGPALKLAGTAEQTSALFRRGGTTEVRLSPNGTWLARFETGVLRDGKLRDELQILDASTGIQSFVAKTTGLAEFEGVDLDWAGDDTLLLTVHSDDGTSWVYALGPISQPNSVVEKQIFGTGWVVDSVPHGAHAFIYARNDTQSGEVELYRIPLDSLISGQPLSKQWILDRKLENDVSWLVNQSGDISVALQMTTDALTVVNRNNRGSWSPALQLPASSALSLAGYGETENEVYVLTNHQREQVELVALDLTTGKLTTKLAVPGHDLLAPIRSERRVTGVRDRSAGAVRTHYLTDQQRSPSDRPTDLAEHYQLHFSTPAGDKDLYFANSASGVERALLRTGEGKWLTVGIKQPWLAQSKFADTQVLSATAPDGLEIQGFLTAPEGSGPFPVLLMPHGGPIAVSDNADFDTSVQFWAKRGYAVVRANYRGSSGFGKKFLDSGKRQWGRQIEADIAAVLALALRDPRLDATRVGIWGASYGGYSALISTINDPERFPCAVSVAGVTDLPLLFTSSDWAQKASLTEEMKEIVGDPKQALDDLLSISPLYQLERLKSQVLLMHGNADERVAAEHTQRFAFRAKQLGKSVAVRYFNGEGHAFQQLNSVVQMHNESAEFLDKCLNVKAEASGPIASAKS